MRLDRTNASFATLENADSVAVGVDRGDGRFGFRLTAPLPKRSGTPTLTYWRPPTGSEEGAHSVVATWEHYSTDELWQLHIAAVADGGEPVDFDMFTSVASATSVTDYR